MSTVMARWDPDENEPSVEPARVRERRALRELDAVYREIERTLQGFGCAASGECCRLAVTRREPYLLPVERLRLTRALERAGLPWPVARADGACALLDESGVRCSVYADRPFGCRTFFCSRRTGPKREPTAALHALSARVTAASDGLEPGGEPVPITRLFRQRND